MAYRPFRNLGLKLFSVVLAAGLWLAVAGERPVERTVRVPLQLENIPEGLEVLGDLPEFVTVRLRGNAGRMGTLTPGEVLAMLDLQEARPGLRLFHLAANDVISPFGVSVVTVTPSTIPLEVEQTVSRAVPVEAALEGRPAPGFVRGKVTVTPPVVDVIGPESRVRELTAATTDAVSVEGTRQTVEDDVGVGLSDPTVRLTEATTAHVVVEIEPAPVDRTVADVPVRLRNLRPGLSATATPEAVAVRVQGPRAQVAELAVAAVGAFVELSGLGRGRFTLPVGTESPQGIRVIGADPELVEVVIR